MIAEPRALGLFEKDPVDPSGWVAPGTGCGYSVEIAPPTGQCPIVSHRLNACTTLLK